MYGYANLSQPLLGNSGIGVTAVVVWVVVADVAVVEYAEDKAVVENVVVVVSDIVECVISEGGTPVPVISVVRVVVTVFAFVAWLPSFINLSIIAAISSPKYL